MLSLIVFAHSLMSLCCCFAQTESVPERSSGVGESTSGASSMEELLASQRAKAARLAEQDRQSSERIQAAASHMPVHAQSSAAGAAAGESARNQELLAQLRVQSITIEELEKRKRTLTFELESADVHLASLLSEQRNRFEAAAAETERRAQAQLDAERASLTRAEARHAGEVRELQEKVAALEARRGHEVAAAVARAEEHWRSLSEHAARIAAQAAEAARQHYERELSSAAALHAQEVASLKAQSSSSLFLRSLVSQVESSAANLDSLSKKVYQERNASERMTFEQLQVRDKLLSEKEVSLEAERKQNETLLATFQKLQRDHEEDKIRLRDEHLRLSALQHDVRSESALLKEAMVSERDMLRKERALLQQQRDAWEVKQKRESAELEMKRELNERAHGQICFSRTAHCPSKQNAELNRHMREGRDCKQVLRSSAHPSFLFFVSLFVCAVAVAVQTLEGLEEAQRERAEMLKQLDDEREEIRVEKSAQPHNNNKKTKQTSVSVRSILCLGHPLLTA